MKVTSELFEFTDEEIEAEYEFKYRGCKPTGRYYYALYMQWHPLNPFVNRDEVIESLEGFCDYLDTKIRERGKINPNRMTSRDYFGEYSIIKINNKKYYAPTNSVLI